MTTFHRETVSIRGYMSHMPRTEVEGYGSVYFSIYSLGRGIYGIVHKNSGERICDADNLKQAKSRVNQFEEVPVSWDEVTIDNFRLLPCLDRIKQIAGRN